MSNKKETKVLTAEERVRKNGKDRIIAGVIFMMGALILIAVLFFAKPDDEYLILVFCVAIVLITGFVLISSGIRILKNSARHTEEIKTKDWRQPDTAIYKNKGWTYEIAEKLYCGRLGKNPDELTKEDEEAIWDCSYDDFAYLLMWIIEKDFYRFAPEQYGAENEEDQMEFIARIKNRKVIPTDFFIENEGFLYEEEIKPEALGFVLEYIDGSEYVKGRNVPKKGDYIGAYEAEVEQFANEKLNSDLFGFPFRWEDYDEFKGHIEEAFVKYQKK